MIDKDLIAIQIKNEEECYGMSLDKYDKELNKKIQNGSFVDSKEAIILFKTSIDIVEKYIEDFKNTTLNYDYIKMKSLLLSAYPKDKDLAFMLLRVTISVLINGEGKALKYSKMIGTLAIGYIKTALLEKKEIDLVEKHKRKFKRFSEGRRKAKLISLSNMCVSLETNNSFVIKLGTLIINIINKSGCNLIKEVPKTDCVYLRMSDEAMALLLKAKVFFGSLMTVHYPFVVPPKKWTKLEDSGGYYTNKSIKFIRTRNIKDYKIICSHKPNLDRLFSIVNKIQESPFRINKKILDLVKYIDEHHIVSPDSSKTSPYLIGHIHYNDVINPYEIIKRENYKEDYQYYKALDIQKEVIDRIKSKRIGFDLALMIADKFKDYDKIYFSYNTDFRGRLYPIQQYLNPQGTDVTKALLEYGNGYKLTDEGFYWLKIHGANCLGFDKCTYEERINEVDKRHYEIMEIAKDPIENISLWYNVDSPLLYVAFCNYYSQYILDRDSLTYCSVALDGTCSGIQMYSGLLKDYEGALAVNVVSKDNKVSDIYGIVAEEVKRLISIGEYTKEYEVTTKGGRNVKVNTLLEAHSIKDKINRSLTKRNVMTQPYSVTKRGMFEQIYDLLQEYEEDNKVFWQGDKWTVAMLLSELNDKAIGTIVKGAKEGQVIIKDILSKSLKTNDYAYWETPIFNFPVLQRIKKEKLTRLNTPLGKLVIYSTTDETHYLRMLNGIAPNFIHSIDATVLYKTVELCIEKGVSEFSLIHDSYGVHPNNIPILNNSFREAYIEVFKNEPLLQFTKQLCEDEIDNVKKAMINTLDLDEVRNSKYIIT